MDKWEYLIETCPRAESYKDFANRLNEIGKEGWEAVSTGTYLEDIFVLLKRKIQPTKLGEWE